MTDAAFKLMTDNALNYLRLAPADWATKPDQYAIKVYTAVELFIKARLLREHWSLIVTKEPHLDRFNSGDFVSVSFDEATKRLSQVVGAPLPSDARKAFDDLRKYRNKVVHFGVDDNSHEDWIAQQGATRTLAGQAWLALRTLLHSDWAQLFNGHLEEFDRIDRNMINVGSAIDVYGRFREVDISKWLEDHKLPGTNSGIDWDAPLHSPEELEEAEQLLDKDEADEDDAASDP